MTAATQRRQKVPVVLAVTGFLNRADRQMLSTLIEADQVRAGRERTTFVVRRYSAYCVSECAARNSSATEASVLNTTPSCCLM